MLMVLASVLVIRAGLDAALSYADSKVEVIAYLKSSVTEGEARSIQVQIEGIDGVKAATYVSADDALAAFKVRLKERGEPDLTGNLDVNPLPASYEIALDNPSDTGRVADGLASITAASSFSRIIDGRALAESLVAITGALRIVGLIIVIGFSLAVLAVVVNAIRLAILARSDEIAIMRIVGASATWVRLPFILEGLAIGAAGRADHALYLRHLECQHRRRHAQPLPCPSCSNVGDPRRTGLSLRNRRWARPWGARRATLSARATELVATRSEGARP